MLNQPELLNMDHCEAYITTNRPDTTTTQNVAFPAQTYRSAIYLLCADCEHTQYFRTLPFQKSSQVQHNHPQTPKLKTRWHLHLWALQIGLGSTVRLFCCLGKAVLAGPLVSPTCAFHLDMNPVYNSTLLLSLA